MCAGVACLRVPGAQDLIAADGSLCLGRGVVVLSFRMAGCRVGAPGIWMEGRWSQDDLALLAAQESEVRLLELRRHVAQHS